MNSLLSVLFFVHFAPMVKSKIECDYIRQVRYNNQYSVQERNEIFTYTCEFPFDRCCAEGCCPSPLYALAFVGIFSLFTFVAVILIVYIMNLMCKLVYKFRRRGRNPTTNRNSKELPPDYDVAIYLPVPQKDDLPTFEEATKQISIK